MALLRVLSAVGGETLYFESGSGGKPHGVFDWFEVDSGVNPYPADLWNLFRPLLTASPAVEKTAKSSSFYRYTRLVQSSSDTPPPIKFLPAGQLWHMLVFHLCPYL